MAKLRKVIVLGLDGLDPRLTRDLLARNELPQLRRLAAMGGFSTVRTTSPAQTPVAWSTFATGTNPGGHGIFDFLRRDPDTYLPDLALTRYEQRRPFLSPQVTNQRGGTPLWEVLSDSGVPSVVLRCPCTYPPDTIRGRMLSEMGVPDLRGSLGTSTTYTSGSAAKREDGEQVFRVRVDADDSVCTHLIGPRDPKTQTNLRCRITVKLHPGTPEVTLLSNGPPSALTLRVGEWSDWLHVGFKVGLLRSVKGMVRFFLSSLEPHFELYASPINFDPDAPMFPISSPPSYAKQLAKDVGAFYTTGMVEDHDGLSSGRLDEQAYLNQCDLALIERSNMMQHELDRFDEGFLFCLFDTPDRIQHMFWRFREPEHPANRGKCSTEMTDVVDSCYRRADEIVGDVLEQVDDQTLFVVLSDHGFSSFQRGVNLNTWLYDNGFLALKSGACPGDEEGDLFRHVDWHRTRAYALGLGGIYLNRKGRERDGIVTTEEVGPLSLGITEALTGLVDTTRQATAVRTVSTRPDRRRPCEPCRHASSSTRDRTSTEHRTFSSTSLKNTGRRGVRRLGGLHESNSRITSRSGGGTTS